MKLLYKLSNLLFPPKCTLCKRILTNDQTDLCSACRAETPEHPQHTLKLPYLTNWTALWYYEGNVRSSLLRFKFGNARSYAATYGKLLAMKLLREEVSFDVLTWVPISKLRKWHRGYDQVLLITEAIAAELELSPVATLKKIRHNRPQSKFRNASQRRANVLGVYHAVEPENFAGKRVLLIDDIITTGATAGECARILLSAGAKDVFCAAVAAAPHQRKKQ